MAVALRPAPGSPWESAEIRAAVEDILGNCPLLSLATVDGGGAVRTPWSSLAFFAVTEDLQLVILTENESRHARNVAREARVALTVCNSPQAWGPGALVGLQAVGRCTLLSGPSLSTAFDVYKRRFPDVERYYDGPRNLEPGLSESGLYGISLHYMKILFEGRFGLEKYVEATVVR